MSTFTSSSPSLLATGIFDVRPFAGISQRTFAALCAWRANMRQRRELVMLNDVELRELSLTAADVSRESGRSFWESVHVTSR